MKAGLDVLPGGAGLGIVAVGAKAAAEVVLLGLGQPIGVGDLGEAIPNGLDQTKAVFRGPGVERGEDRLKNHNGPPAGSRRRIAQACSKTSPTSILCRAVSAQRTGGGVEWLCEIPCLPNLGTEAVGERGERGGVPLGGCWIYDGGIESAGGLGVEGRGRRVDRPPLVD